MSISTILSCLTVNPSTASGRPPTSATTPAAPFTSVGRANRANRDQLSACSALRLGEAIYNVLRPAGFSDQAVVGTDYDLLTYILGFVALEIPRAGTDPQTSDEFVRRMWAFFAALPPGEFPHTVELAALLARISTDDQFDFGIRTFLAGLNAQAS